MCTQCNIQMFLFLFLQELVLMNFKTYSTCPEPLSPEKFLLKTEHGVMLTMLDMVLTDRLLQLWESWRQSTVEKCKHSAVMNYAWTMHAHLSCIVSTCSYYIDSGSLIIRLEQYIKLWMNQDVDAAIAIDWWWNWNINNSCDSVANYW